MFGRGGGRVLSKKLLKLVKEMRKTENPQTEDGGRGAAEKSRRKRMKSKEFLEIYDKLWKEGPRVKYQNPDRWVEPKPGSEK